MKKIILLTLLIGELYAVKYELIHLRENASLNVRDSAPMVGEVSMVVGKIPASTIDISIKECMELPNHSEWCYIKVPRGASHLEGWVNSYFLTPMEEDASLSEIHINNFLNNFYLADEENFLDKLQVFYSFPMQQYFDSKNVSLMELREKKVRYYKRWPKRSYRVTYMRVLKRTENYIDVKATVRWRVENSDDYEEGRDVQKIRLLPTESTFKVSAIKYLLHDVYPKLEPIIIEEVDGVPLNIVRDETQDSSSKKIPSLNNKEIISSANGSDFNKNAYYIKAGSFFSAIDKSYLNNIIKEGFTYFIKKVYQGKKVIRRVFIGPFTSEKEAQKALVKVRAKINQFAYIQRRVK